MMQDRKALQAGTSHFLGQNFARASDIRFQNADEKEEYAWTTSWGSSTRLIGGVIMTHGDDDGVILPPRVASSHVVLLPIYRKPEERQTVMEYVDRLAAQIREQSYGYQTVRVEIDSREIGGARGWDWIKKGIPLRVEIGPRDIANDAVFVGRRDARPSDKQSIERKKFVAELTQILDDIQTNLFRRACDYRDRHSVDLDNQDDFRAFFTPANTDKPEIHGGFVRAEWCGSGDCEKRIKDDLGVTIRCIPFDAAGGGGNCIGCGKEGRHRVIFAKAY
jgi:prolyl-tRNA synthetase